MLIPVRLSTWQPEKSEVTRDIASPFAYGKVRTDYPVLKGFSDAELYEGMGDFVPPPPPNPSRSSRSSSSSGNRRCSSSSRGSRSGTEKSDAAVRAGTSVDALWAVGAVLSLTTSTVYVRGVCHVDVVVT